MASKFSLIPFIDLCRTLTKVNKFLSSYWGHRVERTIARAIARTIARAIARACWPFLVGSPGESFLLGTQVGHFLLGTLEEAVFLRLMFPSSGWAHLLSFRSHPSMLEISSNHP